MQFEQSHEVKYQVVISYKIQKLRWGGSLQGELEVEGTLDQLMSLRNGKFSNSLKPLISCCLKEFLTLPCISRWKEEKKEGGMNMQWCVCP